MVRINNVCKCTLSGYDGTALCTLHKAAGGGVEGEQANLPEPHAILA